VKKMSKMSKKKATGILLGVVKVSRLFTSSVANSKAGKKISKFFPERFCWLPWMMDL
ncbi:hypothetical protein ACH5RR_021407, partial [Cinchona calisaya]